MGCRSVSWTPTYRDDAFFAALGGKQMVPLWLKKPEVAQGWELGPYDYQGSGNFFATNSISCALESSILLYCKDVLVEGPIPEVHGVLPHFLTYISNPAMCTSLGTIVKVSGILWRLILKKWHWELNARWGTLVYCEHSYLYGVARNQHKDIKDQRLV